MPVELKGPARVVSFVWETVTGLSLEPLSGDVLPGSAGQRLGATLQFGGAWEGRISLDCPLTLARRAAAAMFGCVVSSAGTDQALDALGELTNIIAGNLKVFLPVPSRLGLPSTRILEAPEAGGEGQRFLFQEGPDILVVAFQGTPPWVEPLP